MDLKPIQAKVGKPDEMLFLLCTLALSSGFNQTHMPRNQLRLKNGYEGCMVAEITPPFSHRERLLAHDQRESPGRVRHRLPSNSVRNMRKEGRN